MLSVGGYSTNAFGIGYLARSQDLIVYDELIHNSALAGCRMTSARRFSFPHNDYNALERILAEHRSFYERVFVLVEGVYSMDGDIPDIPRIIEIKNRYRALLMVDEAHSMGVIGPRGLGVTDYFQLDGRDIDIHYGSMSKAFWDMRRIYRWSKTACCNSEVLRAWCTAVWCSSNAGKYGRRLGSSADYASGARACFARAKQRSILCGPCSSRRSRYLSEPRFRRRSDHDARFRASLMALGSVVQARHLRLPHDLPVVPRDKSRLRFFINTNHTIEQIDQAVDLVAELIRNAPPPTGLM